MAADCTVFPVDCEKLSVSRDSERTSQAARVCADSAIEVGAYIHSKCGRTRAQPAAAQGSFGVANNRAARWPHVAPKSGPFEFHDPDVDETDVNDDSPATVGESPRAGIAQVSASREKNHLPQHSIATGRLATLPALLLTAFVTSCGGDSQNLRPVAVSISQVVEEDTAVALSLAATDAEGDAITFHVATPPAHGALDLNERTGQALYSPAADFAGTVTFTFTANDRFGQSTPAQVTIVFLPVNDAPRFPEIPELANLADSPVTRWTLGISDPDSTEIIVEVLNGDPQVAQVTYDNQSDAIEIRAESYGGTTITVRASDGLLTTERSFDFRARRVTREVEVTVPDPSSMSIVIHNPLETAIDFGLGWNKKSIFESMQDLVASAAPNPESDGDAAVSLWNYMISNVYHNQSFAAERWEHDPLILVNSIGFGLCDDVSAALAFMAREHGLSARVWFLDGHVAPEILVNGKWQMYDPDIKIYYRGYNGDIAGVEELTANPALITSPVAPLYPVPFYGYEQFIADIYSTAENNRVEPWYESGASPVSGTFTLPPGASLQFPGTWVDSIVDHQGAQVPAFATIRVSVPPTTKQVLRMPLVLLALRGQGSVRIAGQDYLIGSATLEELLQSNRAMVPDVEILDATTDLEFVMLLNPRDAGITEKTAVRLTGLKVPALDIGTEPLASGAAFADPGIPTFPF